LDGEKDGEGNRERYTNRERDDTGTGKLYQEGDFRGKIYQ
jgi:hypothetical protein